MKKFLMGLMAITLAACVSLPKPDANEGLLAIKTYSDNSTGTGFSYKTSLKIKNLESGEIFMQDIIPSMSGGSTLRRALPKGEYKIEGYYSMPFETSGRSYDYNRAMRKLNVRFEIEAGAVTALDSVATSTRESKSAGSYSEWFRFESFSHGDFAKFKKSLQEAKGIEHYPGGVK